MIIFSVLVLYFLLVLFDFLPILKSKKKKESWLYAILASVSFILMMLKNLNILKPSLYTVIKVLIKYFAGE